MLWKLGGPGGFASAALFLLIFDNQLAVDKVASHKRLFLYPSTFISAFSEEPYDMSRLVFQRFKRACEKLGYEVTEGLTPDFNTEHYDVIIMFDIHPDNNIMRALDRCGARRKIALFWEPPTVVPLAYFHKKWHLIFDRIYTLFDDLVDHKLFFKFYDIQPTFEILDSMPSFEDRKFCVMVAGNKFSWHPRELYTQRIGWIELMGELGEDFELWGNFLLPWENDFYFRAIEYPCLTTFFQGSMRSKLSCYKNYKFAVCYENMRGRSGYFTANKIIFPLLAGCVPVCWGADNILDYIPANCFIDRACFESDVQLHKYLRGMSKNEYSRYVSAAQEFVRSDRPRLFSMENFMAIVLRSFQPDYDTTVIFNEEELKELGRAKRAAA